MPLSVPSGPRRTTNALDDGHSKRDGVGVCDVCFSDARRELVFVLSVPNQTRTLHYVANQDGTLNVVDFPHSVVSRIQLSGGGSASPEPQPTDGST